MYNVFGSDLGLIIFGVFCFNFIFVCPFQNKALAYICVGHVEANLCLLTVRTCHAHPYWTWIFPKPRLPLLSIEWQCDHSSPPFYFQVSLLFHFHFQFHLAFPSSSPMGGRWPTRRRRTTSRWISVSPLMNPFVSRGANEICLDRPCSISLRQGCTLKSNKGSHVLSSF